ncbi:MAG: hypothetical protein ABEK17_04700 [Candidatus Aenigmatarchaeota archaeon]
MELENEFLIPVSIVLMIIVTTGAVALFASMSKTSIHTFYISSDVGSDERIEKEAIRTFIKRSEICWGSVMSIGTLFFDSLADVFRSGGGSKSFNCSVFCSSININDFPRKLAEAKVRMENDGSDIHINISAIGETLGDSGSLEKGKVYQIYAPKSGGLERSMGGIKVEIREIDNMECSTIVKRTKND